MRLRKPCEHRQYDAHYAGEGLPIFGYSGDIPLQCLGGEFLSDEALVIERDANGKFPGWITEPDGPVWRQCGGTDDLLEDIYDALIVRETQ